MITINPNALKIAVDFDGTIVENAYPGIGREMLFAFATMKELQKKGHQLILWTFRTGDLLEDAVNHCQKNGIDFYAVNKNYPGETEYSVDYSRKLHVDLFIDDRNVGGFIGWSRIWQLLSPGDRTMALLHPEAHKNFSRTKKGFSLFKRNR